MWLHYKLSLANAWLACKGLEVSLRQGRSGCCCAQGWLGGNQVKRFCSGVTLKIVWPYKNMEVERKGRCIVIIFSDNCGDFSLISGSFLKVNCKMQPELQKGTFCLNGSFTYAQSCNIMYWSFGRQWLIHVFQMLIHLIKQDQLSYLLVSPPILSGESVSKGKLLRSW